MLNNSAKNKFLFGVTLTELTLIMFLLLLLITGTKLGQYKNNLAEKDKRLQTLEQNNNDLSNKLDASENVRKKIQKKIKSSNGANLDEIFKNLIFSVFMIKLM